ncbi:hypothetical protein H0G86_005618 [Trichoderma simmonsii]|uniref:Uncharacterized protein n=1 Tax=Trichoderma simmonsii TaxID=1491479 RepID=A0A8G0LCT7_9HYPO|nr:hypothetical protein H0G86_005618 [Trichoderma simmonsii]
MTANGMLRVTGSFGINQDCESMTTVPPTREASVFLRSYHTSLLLTFFSHLSFSHSFSFWFSLSFSVPFSLHFYTLFSFFKNFVHFMIMADRFGLDRRPFLYICFGIRHAPSAQISFHLSRLPSGQERPDWSLHFTD